jgi:2-phospho-L-lactate guanylyltransferase (CobY/MobA/RfbA family)
MTTVAVLCDAPRSGNVLGTLAETSPLSEREVADLYSVLLKDTVRTVAQSGGDLLVNYRDEDAEAAVREVVAEAVDPDEARFEVQVGETFSGRVGNTATHLLEQEEVGSVAVVRPEAAFLARTQVDEAAMKLRSSEVVLGPAPGGRVYYAGFADAIDFADAYAPPALETLTDRAIGAGHAVDFIGNWPFIATGSDLADVIVQLQARRTGEAIVPPHLDEWVAAQDLVVEADETGLTLDR